MNLFVFVVYVVYVFLVVLEFVLLFVGGWEIGCEILSCVL